MLAVYIGLALLAAYIVFIFAPALVCFYTVFTRRDEAPLDAGGAPRTYYEPHREQMLSCIAFLRKTGLREVCMTARDGTKLCADYLDGGFSRTAVLFHGYRGNSLNTFCVAGRDLFERDFNVLFVCQRAHGKSGGRRSSLGIVEQYDVLDWLHWLEEAYPVGQLLLYGVSMGCASVAYASDKLPDTVRAMILDCGFTSPYEQIHEDFRKRHLPWRQLLVFMRVQAKLLLHIDLKTPVAAALAHTNVPAFFLHGTADAAVPIAQSKQNYAACASEKQCFWVQGAQHTVSYLEGGPAMHAQLFSFIDTYFI